MNKKTIIEKLNKMVNNNGVILKYQPPDNRKPIILRHRSGVAGGEWEVVDSNDFIKGFYTKKEAGKFFAEKLKREVVNLRVNLKNYMAEQNKLQEDILEMLKEIRTWED